MMFTDLHLGYLPAQKQWELLSPLTWRPGTPEAITVPAGYVTDLDSVPRVPVIHARYKGQATKSAVLHDWLCDSPEYGWAEAARIFLSAMADEGLPRRDRWPIYLAVRAYGIATGKRGAWS